MVNWRRSTSMPPDLVPRAAYLCDSAAWSKLVWRCQRVLGTAGLARRPLLWRDVALFTKHKKGDPSCYSLFMKVQMGLLQEATYANRWRGSICHAELVAQYAGLTRGLWAPTWA